MAISQANMQWIKLLHKYCYKLICQTYRRPEIPPEGKHLHVRSTLLISQQLHPRLAFSPSLLYFPLLTRSSLSSEYLVETEEQGIF